MKSLCIMLTAIMISSMISSSCPAADEQLLSIAKEERIPLLAKALLFPRIRMIYNLYMNSCQSFNEEVWIDHPLFHDSSLNNLPAAERKLQNSSRQLESVMSYGADGFEILFHGEAHLPRYFELIDAAEKRYSIDGNKIMPSILGHILLKGPEKAAQEFSPLIERLIKSPAAARINGKLLIASYRTDYISPEKLAQFIGILKQKYGDSFYFISTISELKGKELSNYIWLRNAFVRNGGKLPESEINAAKDYLRGYLKVSDGLLMNGVNHIDTEESNFDDNFYEEFVIRLFVSVLNEAENKGKFLGLSASLGYINHIAGGTQLERGTWTLRRSLDAAYSAKADFIIMPEWNELNENTCLEPSAERSFSSRRVIRYYAEKAAGQLSKIKEDRAEIPNLIVSARAVLREAEDYELEVLNVPDSSRQEKYNVLCRVYNEKDELVKEFAPSEFKPDEMKAELLKISPEERKSARTLKPHLEIRTLKNGILHFEDSLPITRIQSTWNTNYISSKQPLRDIASMSRMNVKFSDKGEKTDFEIEAESNDENIRHIEILEDDTLVYSYDKSGKFQTAPGEELIQLYYNSLKEINPFPMTISVEGGKIRAFQDRLRLDNDKESQWKSNGEYRTNWKTNRHRRGAIFIVTDSDTSTLKIQTASFTETIKVADLKKYGQIRKTYPNTVSLTLEIAGRTMDMPEPADKKTISFSTSLKKLNPDAIYKIRLITMSGKTYTKGPFPAEFPLSGEQVSLKVFSGEDMHVKTVSCDKSLCPDLTYTADKVQEGFILPGPASRWNATTGGGGEYGGAFHSDKSYPDKTDGTAPRLVQTEKGPVFEFDGKGNYLHFPSELIPSYSAFTLEFEFKPYAASSQRLLTARGQYEGLIDLRMNGSSLECTFRGEIKKGEDPYFKTLKLQSKSPLKINDWNKVKLTYNLEKLSLTVNDGSPSEIACDREAWWKFTPASFGGWGTDSKDYFKGQLRYLRVKHFTD